MMKNILIILLSFLIMTCSKEKPVDIEQEKTEVLSFLKDYSNYLNSNSIKNLNSYWVESDNTSYIALEQDTLIIGFENLNKYLLNRAKDIERLEYSSWNPSIWISPTKSEAMVVFYSTKKIIFKNGFSLSLNRIRNSMLLVKFEGKWKILNLHESVRQK